MEPFVQDYTALSATYDAIRHDVPAARFKESLRAEGLLDLVELRADMRVLDVATGTGRGALLLAPRVATVVGIDATGAMLTIAQRKANDQGIRNITFTRGDAFGLPFPDHHIDVVICLNFLHLFRPVALQARLVREMARVLKPGGQLVVELDNALHGGLLGPLRKYGVKDIGYNWPWDIRHIMGPAIRIDRVAGVNLPGLWRLRGTHPRAVAWAERQARNGWLRNLAGRLLVSGRKRSAASRQREGECGQGCRDVAAA